jgi:hypothetical protein
MAKAYLKTEAKEMSSSLGKSVLLIVTAICIIITLILAGLVAGYYEPAMKEKSSRIIEQNQEIDDLNSQISMLQTQVEGLNAQIAGLNDTITKLNDQITELQNEKTILLELNKANLVTALGANDIVDSNPRLWITGGVMNTGSGVAYKAGLYINGYSSSGDLILSVTVPITSGSYQGTVGNSSTLSTLLPLQSVSVRISVFHTGALATWTVVPMWSNTS